MITSYLQGGLGNQMFQMAAAHSLSLKLNVECKFDFNSSFVSTQGYAANKYKDNIFKNINNGTIDFKLLKLYREPNFKFDELPLTDDLILMGNFQSEKYFLEHKNEIKKMFYFDNDINNVVNDIIKEKSDGYKLTAIHVRRGDYLSKPNFHPSCSMDFYNQAMEIINAEKYVVLSDDMKWCKENFIGEKFIFSPFTNEIDDLHLLINCDNHIIANSSFSWWGAYLCEKENKVVAPKIWFGPDGPQDTEDIYINNWIKI